jgi:hypothetical protein
MAFNFGDGRVTATSPTSKQVVVQAVKLTFADFTTGGTASVKAILPDNASIVRMSLSIKTALTGNGISAAVLSVGISGTVGKFVNGSSAAFGAAGAYTVLPLFNAFQDYDPTSNSDISLLFTGTATTGNPTAGEMYVLIEYVR